jgi:hypothetical protein
VAAGNGNGNGSAGAPEADAPTAEVAAVGNRH